MSQYFVPQKLPAIRYTHIKAQIQPAVDTHTPYTYLFHLNAVRALEGCQSPGHYAREEGVDRALSRVLQLIEGGVHEESTEEVGPGDIVHGVLFGGDGARHYLSIEMVRQDGQQTVRGANASQIVDLDIIIIAYALDAVNFQF